VLRDIGDLGGGWSHLLRMGLLPQHVFCRSHDMGCTRILSTSPFFVDWNKMATAWGLTLPEAVSTYHATLAQLGDLGLCAFQAIQLGLTPDLVAQIGEHPNSYRELLGATDADICILFPTTQAPPRLSKRGVFSLRG
jgi:hypothetical protein